MNDLSPDQQRILVATCATADSVAEPIRLCGLSASQWGRYCQARWQAEEDYQANGCKYLPADRTGRGRAETSRLLSDLSARGLLMVDFTAGRASRVRLTRDGDTMARLLCGQPTLATGLGMFHRVCKLLHRKSMVLEWPPTNNPGRRWYRRRFSIFEHGLVWPDGLRDFADAFPIDVFEVTWFMLPFIHAGLIAWDFDTFGWIYYRPSDAGWRFYRENNWRDAELDWGPCWTRQLSEAIADPEMDAVYRSTAKREFVALRTTQPRRSTEIGRLPWGRVDSLGEPTNDDEFLSLLSEESE